MKYIGILLSTIVCFQLGSLSAAQQISEYDVIYNDMVKRSDDLYNFIRGLYPSDQPGANTVKGIARDQFPTENNRIQKLVQNSKTPGSTKKRIVDNAKETMPLIHPKVKIACQDFLLWKRTYGTSAEKAFYVGMRIEDFIYRLFYSRPLAFSNAYDSIVLRPDYAMINPSASINTIGRVYQNQDNRGTDFINSVVNSPALLKDYLSYDEISLATLLGLSGPTHFINNGNRFNRGQLGQPGSYEDRGVYVGLVGARLEKPGYMEYKQVIVRKEQNTLQEGYGIGNLRGSIAIFSKLYGLEFPTYDQVKQELSNPNSSYKDRFVPIQKNNQTDPTMYFDIHAYKKRMNISIENFLLDANERAGKTSQKAYCFVVGLGLGVWQIDDRQTKWMMEEYRDVLDRLNLPHIAQINFSYLTQKSPTQQNPYFTDKDAYWMFKDLKQKKQHMRIIFSKDNPADPLPDNQGNKLLVAMYAWDGNAYPGNEYWVGMLNASGDPAAASCSAIPELQNPLINPFIKRNIEETVRKIK